MNLKQVKQLEPEKSYVRYAKSKFKVAKITDRLGTPFIGIYDEPPSEHIDYINYKNAEFIEPKSNRLDLPVSF